VANRLQVTTGAVKTLIHRLRKRYTALLREEVGRTVSTSPIAEARYQHRQRRTRVAGILFRDAI